MSSYTIKIKQFEGPFELLLFFIERDELDIHDIPIAKITQDFLSYIQDLEQLNLDIASEFIFVAATLMRIKAKMLIPRATMDENGNEIDPRDELVQRLLEYKQYKESLDTLREMEADRSSSYSRGNIDQELTDISKLNSFEKDLESISMFKLISAFKGIMEKFDDRQKESSHRIYKYNYDVDQQSSYILAKLKENKKCNFESLFQGLDNRIHAIVTFLSLLELLNQQTVSIIQGRGINNFWVHKQG